MYLSFKCYFSFLCYFYLPIWPDFWHSIFAVFAQFHFNNLFRQQSFHHPPSAVNVDIDVAAPSIVSSHPLLPYRWVVSCFCTVYSLVHCCLLCLCVLMVSHSFSRSLPNVALSCTAFLSMVISPMAIPSHQPSATLFWWASLMQLIVLFLHWHHCLLTNAASLALYYLFHDVTVMFPIAPLPSTLCYPILVSTSSPFYVHCIPDAVDCTVFAPIPLPAHECCPLVQ